ncbi:MAG TPA: amino acid adenylation domain-containing protein, partial [Thermoanaerobaculia bacterium]|nr:amino acid adenylation domain-containing protein [Thermoanaerobaculia bacterium]
LIGGAGLARGYLRRPDLTAEKFVPHPSAVEPGERLYRTGDLARHLPSGEVEYLGRIDHQIKIRGFRVELGEIEAVLAQHPAVREAVVLFQQDSLAACLVFHGEEAPRGELRAFLKERLPEHMVPSLFVPLAELPLLPNGKADRRAHAALAGVAGVAGAAASGAEETGTAPRSPMEEVVAGIWAEVLGRERVPLQESFFELGGHSLLALRVVSRVRSVLGTEVPLRTLFERPTVASFAGAVAESRAGAARTAPPVTRVRRDGPLPLSFAQQRLWFLDRLEPASAAYNLPVALGLESALDPLDVAALAAALREVARRHEVLRTTFRTVAGAPVQEVRPETAVGLPVVDLTALPAEALRRESLRRAAAEAQRPFDLGRDPMLRATLLATGLDRWAILLTQHHIASDGWSLGVLLRELGALYGAFTRGLPSPLPELEVQYADFAAWQRSWLSGEVLEAEIAYWKAQLAGAPQLLELPADRPRPAVQTFRGASRGFALTPELSQALDVFSRRQGATLFMTLLAAFQTLLARLAGRADISVGTPVAGRTQVETEELIGFFVNTLVLRTDLGGLGGDPSFAALLARVRETTLDAFAHQDLPFEKLVEEVRPERSLSHSPLFQQMFILQNTPSGGAGLPGVKLSVLGSDSETAKFDLTLSMTEAPGRLAGALNYNTDLFDRVTIERWLGHFERLLQAAVQSPEARFSDLPLLAGAERHQLLIEWSDTAAPADPDAGLHRLFEAQAAYTPDAVAVVFQDGQWTYAGLDRQASRLAHRLLGLGVGREDRVGILVERSPEMVAGLLAILKTGASYVPLDPAYPVERLELMAGDAGIKVLLTQGSLAGILPGPRALCWDVAEIESPEAPRCAVGPHDLAYVIYTSGSTGRPKGVQIPHGAIVNFLRSMAETPGLGAADVLLSVTTLSFDIAGLELFLPLARGARVVLVGRDTAADGAALARLLAESGASVMQATPATWQLLLNAGWAGAPWLKVLCGGEALPRDLALRLLQAAGEVWNVYGPTETTVWSAVQRVEMAVVPLGRPIANTQLRILGSRQEVAPVGVPGELHIGGLGLARGYFGRPDLTAERFVPDPFTADPGARLYRTGDLTRYLPGGTVEFLGRIDHQVKVRGFRIELGEIEAVLAAHPAVCEAVCVVREDLPGGRGLAAYVVPAGEAPSADGLRGLLAEKLPAYMVPAHLVFLAALPLTANGKVDRRALPAPDRTADRAEGPVAPRNPVEAELLRIWAEVLDVRPIGVRDDFFRLGGHSLLAVLLMARIEERFGQALPLAALFRSGTVEGLAALLESRAPARSPLVALQPAGELPPFFCVHPAEGGVLCYRSLAGSLGTERPFYGLQAKGTESDREAPHTRIDEMACEYVAAVRAVQPAGPYHLGGWSFGALVAFEMARQLRAAGQEVAALALLDLPAPGSLPLREPDEATLLASLARQAGLEVDAEELQGLTHEARVAHVAERAAQAGLLPAEAGIAYVERKLAFLRAVEDSIRTYEPGPYDGAVTLLRSSEPLAGELARLAAADPGLGWGRYTSEPPSIHFVPGNHQTMIQEPHAAAVASVLRSSLDIDNSRRPV